MNASACARAGVFGVRRFSGCLRAGIAAACLGLASSAAADGPRPLSDQDLLDYAKSPPEAARAPERFVLGTWRGYPVRVTIRCDGPCAASAVRLIEITGWFEAEQTCEEAGGVMVETPRLGLVAQACAPGVVWFAEQLSRVPAFSDAELLAYEEAPYDKAHAPPSRTVVASYRGALVRADFSCPTNCPWFKSRQLYLDPPDHKRCADVGGVETERLVSTDIVAYTQPYCVPKVLLDAEARRRK